MDSPLPVPRSVIEALLREAEHAGGEECCGLLLGGADGRIARAAAARNVSPNRHDSFEIDPEALIAAHKAARSGGPAVLGYYHSHPNGRPDPSVRDRAGACGDGRVWAIVATGAVRFYRDAPQGLAALSYAVCDG